MQNRIRELRLGKGMSIRQLEQKVGLGPGTLGRWERDQVMPRADLAYYVAQALGVSIEYMMGWSDEQGKG